jgi:hypothetical protein
MSSFGLASLAKEFEPQTIDNAPECSLGEPVQQRGARHGPPLETIDSGRDEDEPLGNACAFLDEAAWLAAEPTCSSTAEEWTRSKDLSGKGRSMPSACTTFSPG